MHSRQGFGARLATVSSVPPRIAVAVLAAVMGSASPALAARERVVLVYDNRSSSAHAAELASAAFEGLLARKGYEVVDGVEVKEFLGVKQPATLEPLPPGLADKLLLRFQAERLLTVVINYVLEARPRARGPRANPAVGMTARLLGPDGRVLWRASSAAIGGESSNGRDDRASAIVGTVTTGCERLVFTLPKAKAVPDRELREERGRTKFPLVRQTRSMITAATGSTTP